jgi:hypothetical protein
MLNKGFILGWSMIIVAVTLYYWVWKVTSTRARNNWTTYHSHLLKAIMLLITGLAILLHSK